MKTKTEILRDCSGTVFSFPNSFTKENTQILPCSELNGGQLMALDNGAQ
jgi:hypothetical protein